MRGGPAGVVEEDPDGRSGGVVELARPNRPDERGQETAGDHRADGNEEHDHAHRLLPRGGRTRISPTLRPTTVSELTGIRMAVASGVRRPVSARPIPITL